MILFRALHKQFVDNWSAFEKSSSFLNGARWNLAGTPVIYMSTNVQNAMLEMGNYMPSPAVANALNVMGVFESPSLRLYELRPEELPNNWEQYPFVEGTQELGSRILLDDHYDGVIVPSCTINNELAHSPHNDVRRCNYANAVLNPSKPSVANMRLLDTYSPVYSSRMFQ